jgi:hypothetical protein
MKIEKLAYSSRNGYSVEFRRSGSVVLTPDETYILTLLLKAQLTQNELDAHFSAAEQEVLHRYEKLIGDKRADLSLKYQDATATKRLRRELREMLALWMEHVPAGYQVVMEKILGWALQAPEESGSIMDRMILRALKEGRTEKSYFQHLLDYPAWGMPSPEVLAQLEERVGPLNLESN